MARPRVTGVEAALDAAGRVLVAKGIAATTIDDRIARSHERANYIWPFSAGPSYPAVDVYEPGVL